jgi:poly-gamma-glutamate capsule biosynthesis protein CapA/YwtB (metallophosphatase superfamily)
MLLPKPKVLIFSLIFCSSPLLAQKKDTLTIIGVGDIMMGSNYPDEAGLPANDGLHLMKEVEPILINADITFGNLEGVLLNQGGTPKTCRNPKVCYVFRSPERYVNNLVNAGFDLMSLANNHSADFGEVGKRRSIETLERAGIHQSGQLNKPYVIVEKDSVKYGMASFAPNNGCPDINNIYQARKIVEKLDSLVDIVIVSFHGGAEGPQHEHVPRKNELFYGENRGDVYTFAHQMVEAGADIVFGHGPHVTRAVEVYNDKFIAYSLGNFCTYGGINVNGINGLAPIIKVYINSAGHFLKAQIISTRQMVRGPVLIDVHKQVLRRIQELTKQDFPETNIEIDDNGWVTKSTK